MSSTGKRLGKRYKGLETCDMSNPSLFWLLGQLWQNFQISRHWNFKSQQLSTNRETSNIFHIMTETTGQIASGNTGSCKCFDLLFSTDVYKGSHRVYAINYAHGLVMLCFIVAISSAPSNLCYFTPMSPPLFHWHCSSEATLMNMGKLNYNWATTQHNKAQTMCIIFGMYFRWATRVSAVAPLTNMDKWWYVQ